MLYLNEFAMASTTENPNEENIKCVIIGDNNVGKTRLVCARAYSKFGPNSRYHRYGGQHIPTVWANDHYRNDSEILRNAGDCVDGVDVSLRLWDTFGDHNKNRRFSYGRADVVLMCFSVCDVKSLQNIKKFWLPEVRKHCKFIPLLLVACKIDLRFADLEELNQSKNSLAKKIHTEDILFPEICRQTASDIGCPYYETSVCNGYGIKEVFQNAIRAALTHRKKMYLYRKPSLKHVRKPLLMQPLSPPKPAPPTWETVVNDSLLDFSELHNDSLHSDLLISCQNFKFHAHKVILATSSNVFHRLFASQERNSQIFAEEKTDDSMSTNDVFVVTMRDLTTTEQTRNGVCNDAVPDLLPIKEKNNFDNAQCCDNDVENTPPNQSPTLTNEFEFVQSYLPATAKNSDEQKDILYLNPNISQFSFSNIMKFCYKGKLDPEISSSNWFKQNIQLFTEIFIVSQQFGIHKLSNILTELLNEGNNFSSTSLSKFLTLRKNSIIQDVLWKETYADVTFKVDDGTVAGHKPFLVCGCDMMSAMFGGTFVESANKEISLPGTTVQSLQVVFEYIYTKSVRSFANGDVDYNEIIALADRFCLPNLISLLEQHMIKDFSGKSLSTINCAFYENVMLTLENAQMHNAQQLSEWCLHYLSTNYNDVCKKCKMVKALSLSNQKNLEVNRWPPVWYIKDQDNYEKACKRRQMEEREGKGKYRSSKKS